MIDSIRPLFNANIALTKIASELNVSQATISRQCKKYGLKRDPIWTIVSNEDIIRLTKLGLSTYEMAEKLCISPQTIHERQTKLGINRRLLDCTEEIADKVRKHNVDLTHFQNLDTIGSYWLGVLFADGSIFGSQPYRISLGLAAKDKQWLDQYAIDIGLNNYNISEYINKHGYKSVRVSLSNMHLARLLWSYGLDPRQDYKMILPKAAILKDFVRGLLDGDGCCCIKKGRKSKRTERRGQSFLDIGIYFEKRILATELLNPIQQQSGVRLNGPYKTKNIWIIKATHRKAIQFAKWLWTNPTRYLDRKATPAQIHLKNNVFI